MSEEFKFPHSLLRQIDECCNGGFVLVFIDSESGVEVAISSDSEMVLRALVSKTMSWADATQTMLDNEDQQSIQDFYDDQEE